MTRDQWYIQVLEQAAKTAFSPKRRLTPSRLARALIVGGVAMVRKRHEPPEERMMIQRKMKRSREYMAETATTAQRHDSIDFRMPTGRAARRSYEARVMIDSTSARSIHCSASKS